MKYYLVEIYEKKKTKIKKAYFVESMYIIIII